MIRLLLECVNHTLDVVGILRAAAPGAYPSERVEVAITDVLHRTLFGARAGVNVHRARRSAAAARSSSARRCGRCSGRDDDATGHGCRRERARSTALLTSGRDVFVERGYHSTRVDDLVAAAGVSHGAFYRYFRNKDQLARVLTARAAREQSGRR